MDGMGYLHNQRIAHRDLKTANILMSNQHYSSLSPGDEEFRPTYQARPIACKLTDFGESRYHCDDRFSPQDWKTESSRTEQQQLGEITL